MNSNTVQLYGIKTITDLKKAIKPVWDNLSSLTMWRSLHSCLGCRTSTVLYFSGKEGNELQGTPQIQRYQFPQYLDQTKDFK